ncbi:glutathione peroxidase [Rufibacter latericius]|uniref:Glutathione peroxidase n=1 Tax=Rufibacter latericius TaxID=2487040 RepID=A0A3M9M8H0_9BACT|nr:glutathione peroxidase [Rufibacter latericius]RNI21776.1 glutathione peroxidase [Rufibacter latericius]
MDLRKRIMKLLYPLIMRLSKSTSKGRIIKNEKKAAPTQPFHSLSTVLNNGKPLDFSQLKGKKVLLVNTASNCGYTGQYEELQQLQEQMKGQLEVIGFPANDFKEQEKDDDQQISQFCQINYGVTFPLAKKSVVVKTQGQNPVYNWLTDPSKNGWNQHQPDWNFSKYLLDENGVLTHYFGPAVSPVGEEIQTALRQSSR